MIIRLSLFILGCILGCKSCNNLIINLIRGAGGSRTLMAKLLSSEYVFTVHSFLAAQTAQYAKCPPYKKVT